MRQHTEGPLVGEGEFRVLDDVISAQDHCAEQQEWTVKVA